MNLSKKFRASKEYIIFKDRKIAEIIKSRGLDGVIYTDHFHHPDFWKTQKVIPYNKDDIIRIPGAEITTKKSSEVTVFGSIPLLKKLDQSFPKKLSQGFFPKLCKLYSKVKKLNLKLVSAHHFRKIDHPKENYNCFDGLELDIKNLNTEEKLKKTAEKYNLPVVAGSDAHSLYQVGIAWADFQSIKPINFEKSTFHRTNKKKVEKIRSLCSRIKKNILKLEKIE